MNNHAPDPRPPSDNPPVPDCRLSESPSRPPLRVLVVDDHPLVREGVRRALQRGFPDMSVAEAATGLEALERAPAFRPQLILLDVHLPGLSGLDLIERLRQRDPGLRILMLAGEADPWTVRQALSAGARGYLAKTSGPKKLETAVRAVLDGQVYLSEEIAEALQRAESPGAAGGGPPGLAVLSPREREVLRRLAQGQSTKAIAFDLHLSPSTVETHRRNLMAKLHLDNVADLTRYAIRQGLTSL